MRLLRALRLTLGLAFSTVAALAATTYYVSPAGSDANPGTAETVPFATLQKAANTVVPGDTVLILAGEYIGAPGANLLDINVRGTPSAWTTFRAYPGHQPVLRSTGWQAINLSRAAYVEIAGLTLEGPAYGVALADAQANAASPSASPLFNGHGIQADGRPAATTATMPHHLRVRDTTIRAFGGAGLSFIQADYVELENNTVTDCAWWSRWANSGITLYQNRNYDSDVASYRNRILRNRVANNKSLVPWVATGALSDGNGIIIDDSRNTQNGSIRGIYTGYTLVANNLVVNNGGSGIHSFYSDRVDIFHNTAYHNGQVLNYGEIYAAASGDIRISGNIAVARPNRAVNKTSAASTNLVYSNNVYHGGNQTDYVGAGSVVADPLFVAPSTDVATGDFRLQPASPAVDRGSPALVVAEDIGGLPRPVGYSCDAGVHERQVLPIATNVVYELAPECAPTRRLDVQSASNVNGTQVNIWSDYNGGSQRWLLTSDAPGLYRLMPLLAQSPTRVLEVANASTLNGAKVQIWTDYAGPAQRWRVIDVGSGCFELAPAHAYDSRLEVLGASNTNGAKVQIASRNGGSAQRWKLLPQ